MTTLMERTAMGKRMQLERELHDLRERLADAWWNEEPLSEIQQIEHRIAECKQMLGRHPEMTA